jgi:hypothetical protein
MLQLIAESGAEGATAMRSGRMEALDLAITWIPAPRVEFAHRGREFSLIFPSAQGFYADVAGFPG